MTELNSPHSKEQKCALIEAMLFISPTPLKLSDMYAVLKIPKKNIKQIIDEMIQGNKYGGLELINENSAYCIKVKDEYLDYVRRFNHNREFSRAEIQTISYIAYKNPVNQSEVIKTRGNRAYEHIKNFLNEGFIELEPKGHTNEIIVTRKFLDYFGMSTREELQQYFESRMMKNAKDDAEEESSGEEQPLTNYSSNENSTEEKTTTTI